MSDYWGVGSTSGTKHKETFPHTQSGEQPVWHYTCIALENNSDRHSSWKITTTVALCIVLLLQNTKMIKYKNIDLQKYTQYGSLYCPWRRSLILCGRDRQSQDDSDATMVYSADNVYNIQ